LSSALSAIFSCPFSPNAGDLALAGGLVGPGDEIEHLLARGHALRRAGTMGRRRMNHRRHVGASPRLGNAQSRRPARTGQFAEGSKPHRAGRRQWDFRCRPPLSR
jgi:hypothetical protein